MRKHATGTTNLCGRDRKISVIPMTVVISAIISMPVVISAVIPMMVVISAVIPMTVVISAVEVIRVKAYCHYFAY
jgi:hypothetical protein